MELTHTRDQSPPPLIEVEPFEVVEAELYGQRVLIRRFEAGLVADPRSHKIGCSKFGRCGRGPWLHESLLNAGKRLWLGAALAGRPLASDLARQEQELSIAALDDGEE